jgi:spermidine/putrescine transport system substrate-binding protein
MTPRLMGGVAVAALFWAGPAQAAGQLNIFNWGNYTNPALIEKFEKEHDVDVTVTEYDSNDTALAKLKAGGHGFDIVVPTHSHVPIFIEEGVLLEARPDEMENFKNVAERWRDPDWDPGRRYTVPWQWGTTGIAVNREDYEGDINTSAIFLDVPEELKGKVNVVPEMSDVMALALMYVGGEPCTTDKEVLKKARDAMIAAKPDWQSMDYGTTDKLAAGEWRASVNWNGSTFRARLANPAVEYGYPQEGYPVWMDNVAIVKDAQNVENAKAFMNFIMDPQNAAMISEFARYANGIEGSEQYMPEEMATAPEIDVPEDLADAGRFSTVCSPEAQEFYKAIWTELQK